MRIIYFPFILLFTMLLCPWQEVQARDEPRLLKIVALSRHGVRAPTQDKRTLEMWSQREWPKWPVEKGELTPRGARLVTVMWRDLRSKLLENELLPQEMCPGPNAIYVRADVDERTRATAAALLEGVAPDCNFGFAVLKEKVDPLFHPVKAGLYRFNPMRAVTDVLTMMNGSLDNLVEEFSGTLNILGQISGPPATGLCARFTLTPNCNIADLPNAISISPDGHNVRLIGSLSMGSSMAEIYLLEFGEWPGVPAGWGQVDADTLTQIMPLHAKVFDVINRAPVVAWANGSSLVSEMTAALFGKHHDPRANEAKLAVFVGHDTNLANLGGLLNIDWTAKGYPRNGIPPASALFLELWERNGNREVVVTYFAQPPQALHAPFSGNGVLTREEINAHAPVAASVSSPPIAGQVRYGAKDFEELVKRLTEGAPMAPPQSPPLEFGPVIPKP